MTSSYQSDPIILASELQRWIEDVASGLEDWGDGDRHIDALSGYKDIQRRDWLDESSFILSVIHERIHIPDDFWLFLNVFLKDSVEMTPCPVVTMDWLRSNLHEYTPPSFHLTTKKYFNEYYSDRLQKCLVDGEMLGAAPSTPSYSHFYHQTFHERDKVYLRDLVVFLFEDGTVNGAGFRG